MSRDHIPGFPNKMPKVDWSKNFPVFRNVEGNDATIHLVKFHIHVHILKINFPEDCLMKALSSSSRDLLFLTPLRSYHPPLEPMLVLAFATFLQ